MSEIKITQSSLENGIFRDGQIVSGYVSDNSEIKSSDKGAHAEGYATSDSSIISSGLGSIAAGFADQCGTIKSNSRGSIAIGCADGDGSEYSLISANEKGAIAIGNANSNSSINAFGVGSIALGYSSDTASISSNGSGAIAYGFSTNHGVIDSSGMGTTAEGYSTGDGAQIKATGHGATAKGFAEGENSHIIASGKGSYAEGWAYNGGKLIALGDGSHVEGKSTIAIDNSPFESITLKGQSYSSSPSSIGDYNVFMVVSTENTPTVTTYSNIRYEQQYTQIKQNTILNPGRTFTITYQQAMETTGTYQYKCNQNQNGITIYLIDGQHIKINNDTYAIKNVAYYDATSNFTFELDIRTTTNDVDVTVLEQSFCTTSRLSTGLRTDFYATLYNDNTKYEFSGAQDSDKYISNIDIVPNVGTIVVYNYENNYNIAKTTKVEYINTIGKTIYYNGIVSISDKIIQITKQENEPNDYFDNLKIGQIITAHITGGGSSYSKILDVSTVDEQTKHLTVTSIPGIMREDIFNIESYYEITLDHTLSTITNLNNQIITSKFCGAIGEQSHIEGHNNEAYGNQSHAEGSHTIASGDESHAEGKYTRSIGEFSHAEGYETKAISICSHAEGDNTKAYGFASHAEGRYTQSLGNYSHASGLGTIANQDAMTAIGKYNVSTNTENTLFVVGDGTNSADTNRSDAFRVNSRGSNTGTTPIPSSVQAKVNGVSDVYLGCPIGTVVMWPGKNAPQGWYVCNGEEIWDYSVKPSSDTQPFASPTALYGDTYKNLYNVLSDYTYWYYTCRINGNLYYWQYDRTWTDNRNNIGYSRTQLLEGSISPGAVYTNFTAVQIRRLPDFRANFAIGYDANNPYGTGLNHTDIGYYGGEETHKLTQDEMPSHDHNLNNLDGGDSTIYPSNGTWRRGYNAGIDLNSGIGSTYDDVSLITIHQNNDTVIKSVMTSTGGNQAHNNIPPFLAINFIIKYK